MSLCNLAKFLHARARLNFRAGSKRAAAQITAHRLFGCAGSRAEPQSGPPQNSVAMPPRPASEDTVAHVFRHISAEAKHGVNGALLIGSNDLTEVFRVHAG
jgi:hypothetical protein